MWWGSQAECSYKCDFSPYWRGSEMWQICFGRVHMLMLNSMSSAWFSPMSLPVYSPRGHKSKPNECHQHSHQPHSLLVKKQPTPYPHWLGLRAKYDYLLEVFFNTLRKVWAEFLKYLSIWWLKKKTHKSTPLLNFNAHIYHICRSIIYHPHVTDFLNYYTNFKTECNWCGLMTRRGGTNVVIKVSWMLRYANTHTHAAYSTVYSQSRKLLTSSISAMFILLSLIEKKLLTNTNHSVTKKLNLVTWQVQGQVSRSMQLTILPEETYTAISIIVLGY